MIENKTKTMCHMAWDYPMFFMFSNQFGYCCRTPKISIDDKLLDELGTDFFSNHPAFVERRKALLNDVKHSDCNTCWQLEDAGYKSSRSDSKFMHFMAKNNEVIKNNIHLSFDEYKNVPNLEKSNYSNVIEIVLNNTCDAKCTYCSEFYSTQWYSEKKKHNEVHWSYTNQDNRNHKAEQLFWLWYENKAIFTNKRFGFIGGEPLIIEELYECLDQIIKIHDKVSSYTKIEKMELCITSNLNTPVAYFQKFLDYIPKLEKYFEIVIQISGENIGKDLEYIRNGVKWERWSKNIEYLLANTNVTLAFLPCLNLLSIPRFHLYLEYFANLCKKYKFMTIHHNIVTHPIEQSPMIAPKEFAIYFDKCIEIVTDLNENYQINDNKKHSYKAFLVWLKSVKESIDKDKPLNESLQDAERFYNYTKKLDDRRKTNILQVFPEFESFYKLGETKITQTNEKGTL